MTSQPDNSTIDPWQELLTELRSGTINFDDEAKQLITSLTKELVAEAKPELKAHPLGPVTLADCLRWLNHYEANLLKALEEV